MIHFLEYRISRSENRLAKTTNKCEWGTLAQVAPNEISHPEKIAECYFSVLQLSAQGPHLAISERLLSIGQFLRIRRSNFKLKFAAPTGNWFWSTVLESRIENGSLRWQVENLRCFGMRHDWMTWILFSKNLYLVRIPWEKRLFEECCFKLKFDICKAPVAMWNVCALIKLHSLLQWLLQSLQRSLSWTVAWGLQILFVCTHCEDASQRSSIAKTYFGQMIKNQAWIAQFLRVRRLNLKHWL